LATLLTGFGKSVAESLERLLAPMSQGSDRVLRVFTGGSRENQGNMRRNRDEGFSKKEPERRWD
jgi:hypothetical protein